MLHSNHLLKQEMHCVLPNPNRRTAIM